MNAIWSDIAADLKQGIAEEMYASDPETVAFLNRLIAATSVSLILIGLVVMKGAL